MKKKEGVKIPLTNGADFDPSKGGMTPKEAEKAFTEVFGDAPDFIKELARLEEEDDS